MMVTDHLWSGFKTTEEWRNERNMYWIFFYWLKKKKHTVQRLPLSLTVRGDRPVFKSPAISRSEMVTLHTPSRFVSESTKSFFSRRKVKLRIGIISLVFLLDDTLMIRISPRLEKSYPKPLSHKTQNNNKTLSWSKGMKVSQTVQRIYHLQSNWKILSHLAVCMTALVHSPSHKQVTMILGLQAEKWHR